VNLIYVELGMLGAGGKKRSEVTWCRGQEEE